MTVPNGAILFNNSTGSDTTASGLGSANVYGSSASTTGSSAVVTGIDTTGVSSGDLLWVQSSSGRQFSIIATVDSSTQVTCDDTFSNTESGRTWAIGGKRATLDDANSRLTVGTDASGKYWVVELENTGTDYAITSTVQTRTSTIQGNDESNPTGVAFNQNSTLFSSQSGNNEIKHLSLKCTAASKTLATAVSKGAAGTGFDLHNVTFDATDNWNKAFGTSSTSPGTLRVFNCRINNTITNISDWDNIQQFHECYFANCTGNGISSNSNICIVKNCLFDGCAGSLIYQTGAPYNYWIIQGNIFNGGTQGLGMYTYTWQVPSGFASDNIFSNFTSYAIENNAAYTSFLIFRNAFYNNNNDYNGTLEDNVTLTADPFVAAGDFNLNADAGGGATLRANNYALNTDTSIYPFRQYVSDDFGGGGGGSVSAIHPLRGTQ
jgi:hypothetical protein